MNAGQEIDCGHNARKAKDERAKRRRQHAAGAAAGAVGRVKGPAGVQAEAAGPFPAECDPYRAADEDIEEEQAARHPDIKAGEVQPREGDVLGPEHDRQDKVADDRRYAGDDEHEHHHRAVNGEEVVVKIPSGRRVFIEQRSRREQFQPQQKRGDTADQERPEHADHVHDGNAFVVEGERPGEETLAVRQVVVMVYICPVLLRDAGEEWGVDCAHVGLGTARVSSIIRWCPRPHSPSGVVGVSGSLTTRGSPPRSLSVFM